MSGKILLVDDQKSILLYIQAILSSEGYSVVSASSGEEAFTLFKQGNFDLVISDAIMPPGMNGYELIQKLKMEKPDIPVVLLTGKREKEDVLRGIQAGADDYAVKPVDPQLLIMKIQKLLPDVTALASMVSSKIKEDVSVRGLMQIVSISEMGVELFSDFPLEKGRKLTLNCPTFDSLGLNEVTIRLDEAEKSADGFLIKATFVGLSEKQLGPLRVWIRNRHLKAA